MPKGGKQPGAGRPKGSKTASTLKIEKLRAIIIKRFAKSMKPILDKAVEQAEAGDKFARDWLTDRAMGKAPQAFELPGEGGEILIRWRR